jgi:hypothetical protein
MKKFLVLIPMILFITGCSGETVENTYTNAAGFTEVYISGDCFSNIYVYDKTDVMYVADSCGHQGGISVMLDASGKPMLWNDWKSYYESKSE